jgi:branched-chain amino acid transport system substrate-binding protein
MTDPTGPSRTEAETATTPPGLSRRGLLRTVGTGAAVLGGGAVLSACSSGIKGNSSTTTSSGTIKIGWIHPVTGDLAGFGYPDAFVAKTALGAVNSKLKVGGKTYDIVLKSYDTQSSQTVGGDLAKQAINTDGCDLLFASSTPDTVNGVATVAETLGVPLICSNCPWESWYANLGGNPTSPTFVPKYSVLYFLGAEHIAQCFIPMWNRIGDKYGNNHLVDGAYPNDADGNAFRAVFPTILKGAGYNMKLSAAYTDGTTNYTSMITQFKSSGADFFTNCPEPPDFAAMWTQSIAQGYKPKLATVAKVLLFPTDAYALKSASWNIATDAWWVPSLPWTSSLDDSLDCSTFASNFTAAGLGQPNANLSNYTLFEIAFAALKTIDDPHDKEALAAALPKVSLDEAIAGPIHFGVKVDGGGAPNVAITPPAGIQWQKDPSGQYESLAVVVDNSLLPQAKITGDLLPTYA